MTARSPHNLRIVRHAIEAQGGRVIRIENGGKHFRILVHLANDHQMWLRCSRSGVDPHKLKGWVRQRITNFTANGKGAA